MIRTAVASPSVRTGAALAAVAGIALLAGCSPAATDSTADTGSSSDNGSSSGSGGTPAYADGTYTAEGTYNTPESIETISVTVTLEDDIVTDVEVSGDPQARESQQYQGEFIGGIADVVVGQDIDDLAVSRVAGSSLTSGGFNQAIETIKAEAAL